NGDLFEVAIKAALETNTSSGSNIHTIILIRINLSLNTLVIGNVTGLGINLNDSVQPTSAIIQSIRNNQDSRTNRSRTPIRNILKTGRRAIIGSYRFGSHIRIVSTSRVILIKRNLLIAAGIQNVTKQGIE